MGQKIKTRNDIKIIMLRKNLTFVKMAGELGIHPNVFYLLLGGKVKSEKATKCIEEKMGMPIDKIISAWSNMGTEEQKAV